MHYYEKHKQEPWTPPPGYIYSPPPEPLVRLQLGMPYEVAKLTHEGRYMNNPGMIYKNQRYPNQEVIEYYNLDTRTKLIFVNGVLSEIR
jgi:hypothetical protein